MGIYLKLNGQNNAEISLLISSKQIVCFIEAGHAIESDLFITALNVLKTTFCVAQC